MKTSAFPFFLPQITASSSPGKLRSPEFLPPFFVINLTENWGKANGQEVDYLQPLYRWEKPEGFASKKKEVENRWKILSGIQLEENSNQYTYKLVEIEEEKNKTFLSAGREFLRAKCFTVSYRRRNSFQPAYRWIFSPAPSAAGAPSDVSFFSRSNNNSHRPWKRE